MVKSFIALITPMSGGRPDQSLPGGQGGRPDQSLPGAQPGIDNTLPGQLPRPEHPIFYPLPPGGVIDNTLPGSQPQPDQGLPGEQPKPDQGLPGEQPSAEHPIVLPPGSGNWEPVYIWGGGNVPMPTPPIEIPPEGETDDGEKIKYVPIWTATTGWVTIGIVLPEGPVVTPSKAKRK